MNKPMETYSRSSLFLTCMGITAVFLRTTKFLRFWYVVVRGMLTFLSPLLPGTVDVVFELDADLPLVGLLPDEGVLQ